MAVKVNRDKQIRQMALAVWEIPKQPRQLLLSELRALLDALYAREGDLTLFFTDEGVLQPNRSDTSNTPYRTFQVLGLLWDTGNRHAGRQSPHVLRTNEEGL